MHTVVDEIEEQDDLAIVRLHTFPIRPRQVVVWLLTLTPSKRSIAEIQRLVREEGEVKLSIGENQIAFELNRTLLVSKADRRELRQLSPSDSFRGERTDHPRTADFPYRRSPSFASGERKVELGQTDLFEE